MTVGREWCPECGTQVEATDKFCRGCGFDLTARRTAPLDGDTPPEGFARVEADDGPPAGVPTVPDVPQGAPLWTPPSRPAPPPIVGQTGPPKPPPIVGNPGQAPKKDSTPKKIAAAVAAGIVVIGIIGAAAGGGGGSKKDENASAAESSSGTAAAPEPPPPASIEVHVPSTVKKNRVTVKGESEPGAKVTVEADGGTSESDTADGKGAWKVTLPVDLGENTFDVTATHASFSKGSHFFTVERERSARELAVLREKKRLAAERKRQRQEAKKQAFIASAQTIPYNQLEKNADRYDGEVVKYTGQIFQIQEDYGTSVILLAVTNQGYDFWDDNVWIDYDGTIEGAEDDIITIYGTVTGSKSYETQIGGETYVPQIKAKYIVE
jgi:hypothetical protein